MIDKLFDDLEAFVDYFKKNDSLELRMNLIKTDKLRHWYCFGVTDRKEIWSAIDSDEWRCRYCRAVEDREELWSGITSGEYRYWYCKDVKDRPELRAKLKEGSSDR